MAKELDSKATMHLAERLEKAHQATVEWLTTVLAEEALGGPAALRATPVQAVAAGAYRVAVLPGRWTLERINTAAERLSQSTEQVRNRITEFRGKAAQFSESAADVLGSSAEAAVRTGEKRVRANSEKAGEAIDEARHKTGNVSADQLPIKNYEQLSAGAAAEAVKGLTKAEDIRLVIRYEEAHRSRSSVVSAAQTTLARIAKDAVSSN
jgi:hypothetical protein